MFRSHPLLQTSFAIASLIVGCDRPSDLVLDDTSAIATPGAAAMLAPVSVEAQQRIQQLALGSITVHDDDGPVAIETITDALRVPSKTFDFGPNDAAALARFLGGLAAEDTLELESVRCTLQELHAESGNLSIGLSLRWVPANGTISPSEGLRYSELEALETVRLVEGYDPEGVLFERELDLEQILAYAAVNTHCDTQGGQSKPALPNTFENSTGICGTLATMQSLMEVLHFIAPEDATEPCRKARPLVIYGASVEEPIKVYPDKPSDERCYKKRWLAAVWECVGRPPNGTTWEQIRRCYIAWGASMRPPVVVTCTQTPEVLRFPASDVDAKLWCESLKGMKIHADRTEDCHFSSRGISPATGKDTGHTSNVQEVECLDDGTICITVGDAHNQGDKEHGGIPYPPKKEKHCFDPRTGVPKVPPGDYKEFPTLTQVSWACCGIAKVH